MEKSDNIKTINEGAVFSDETVTFLSPYEPDPDDCVRIRIRLGRHDAERVYLVSQGEAREMHLEKSEGIFDWFSVCIPPESNNRRYFFKIICDEKEYFYNKYGLSESLNEDGNFEINRYYKTPQWSKGVVGYQIFVDRFFNGDKTNDVVDGEYTYLDKPVRAVKEWDALPESSDVCNFYGGDLQGVIDKLDYLSELGINMIYLNPIFVSPSNHKYDIQDYDHIDPHFGKIIADTYDMDKKYMIRTADPENLEASDALFARLVKLAHERGIKVIIDGVFNHCGSFNKWMDREKLYKKIGGYENGAYYDKNSPYRNFFKWNGGGWPDNDGYESWWGYKNHPKLNYEQSDKLFEYIMEIAEKWLLPPFNADGWRIDVAADLGFSREYNHKFWREFRQRVKNANPQALIVSENYGDSSEWLNGDEWDTVMNYDAFMEPVSWFFTGMEKHSDGFDVSRFRNGKDFEHMMASNTANIGTHAAAIAMNELSNHDHSRFLTRTNLRSGRLENMGSDAAGEGINYGIMREAVAFQFIWPGMPTIYYGDEAGLTGWTDPDNRRTYPWGKENRQMLDFHRYMIKLRKENEALKTGSYRFIYSDYGVVSVARFTEKKQIVSVFNNCEEEKTVSLPVWLAGADMEESFYTLLETDADGYDVERKEYTAADGNVEVTVKPYGCIILKNEG